MNGTWTMLDQVHELVDDSAQAATIDPKIDRYVTGAFVLALNAIATGDGESLREGWSKAKALRDRLLDGRDAPQTDPVYVAGRFAALADALGTAAQRCAPDEFGEALADAKYAAILKALAEQPRSNRALAKAVGEDEATVCRKLRDLRALRAVVSRLQGREMVNALTPPARAFLPKTPEPATALIAAPAPEPQKVLVDPYSLNAMKAQRAFITKSSRRSLPTIDAQPDRRRVAAPRRFTAADFAA